MLYFVIHPGANSVTSSKIAAESKYVVYFFFVGAMNNPPCYRTPHSSSLEQAAVDSDSDFPSEVLSSKYASISYPIIFINMYITICTERRPSPIPLYQVHLIFPSSMQWHCHMGLCVSFLGWSLHPPQTKQGQFGTGQLQAWLWVIILYIHRISTFTECSLVNCPMQRLPTWPLCALQPKWIIISAGWSYSLRFL